MFVEESEVEYWAYFFGVCVVWDLMLSSLDNFDTLNST